MGYVVISKYQANQSQKGYEEEWEEKKDKERDREKPALLSTSRLSLKRVNG
jgi:hypothetical protein